MIDAKFGKRRRMPTISHHPMVPRYYLVIAVIIIVVLGGLSALLWFGPPVDEKDPFVSQIRTLKKKIDRQGDLIGVLMKKNDDLQQSATKMQHLREIDQETIARVQDQLKADQSERLKMEEELVFLRGMVSSKLGKGELHLQRLRLEPGNDEHSFSYAFTISKVIKNSDYVEGSVYVAISGEQDGKKLTLPLEKVSSDKLDQLKIRFRYFQNIEGEFVIPSGFKPSGVTIEVKPDDDKFKPVSKRFGWVVAG